MITIYLHGFSGDEKGLADFARAMKITPYRLWLMPGFGGKPVSKAARQSLTAYCKETMNEITAEYPRETFHIIGHSHGAIIAYCLASMYPKLINELTLMNPVAKPRAASRLLSRLLRGATYVVPSWVMIRTMKSRRIVDAVSSYMAAHHTGEARARIYETRRRETAHYTKDMLRLAKHASSFRSHMQQSSVVQPTTIIYDTHDRIAGSRDAMWYAKRCPDHDLIEVTGGHLGVVAIPDNIAKHVTEHQGKNSL